MLAHFPCRWGGCQLLSLYIYGHATFKISTRAFGGWKLGLGLVSWIRAWCGRSPLQQPCKLYTRGDGIGERARKKTIKCLFDFSQRPQFNALLLQPPPWLEVPLPLLLHFAISSVPRKRKVVAPDTFVTSSKRISNVFLIKNVDIRELIEDLMKIKVPPPAYRRIQEFLTKICLSFSCFIHSFHGFEHMFFLNFWILAF